MAAATQRKTKSVITCDTEGRIQTFNDGACEIFGWEPDEVIGKKRVSLFSPGLIVLGHVENWLETAREEGEYRGRTCFVRKDGTPFAAKIRITTTQRDGEQLGYCGVTEPLDDVDPAEVMPDISLSTRLMSWLVITRAPFLSATLVPILLAAAWVATSTAAAFDWLAFGLAMVGAFGLHIAANCYNDYFDWKSGTDKANNDYFQALTGGSRAIEMGLVTSKGMFSVATVAAVVGVGCGAALIATKGWGILGFGLAGLFSAYFYTAPPLRLVARKGLGELVIALNFGPLLTGGAAYALTGTLRPSDLLVGVPLGLLTAAILWINEFPDAESDAQTGKEHLVVVLGKRKARFGFALLLAAAFATVGALVFAGPLSMGALLSWLTLPIAAYAAWVCIEHYDDRQLVAANKATIALQAIFGLAMAGGILWLG